MADTQHNLRIKATLDASQLQQEIERLNGQKYSGGGGGASGAARSTSSLLSKLDSTLNKLNTTMQHMSQVMASSGRPGQTSPAYITGPNAPIVLPSNQAQGRQYVVRRPPVVNNLPSNTPIAPQSAVAPAAQPSPPSPLSGVKRPRFAPPSFAPGMDSAQARFILNRAIFDAGEISQKLFGKPIASLNPNQIKAFAYQMLKDKNAPFSGPDAKSAIESIFGPNLTAGSKLQAFMTPGKKGGGPANPPIVSKNVMRVFPDGSFQLIDRDQTPQQYASQRDPYIDDISKRKAWYKQVRFGWGMNMAGNVMQGFSQSFDDGDQRGRILAGAGNVVSSIGMGTMVHPLVGAFAGLATAAVEVTNAMKQMREEYKKRRESMDATASTSRASLIVRQAEELPYNAYDFRQLKERLEDPEELKKLKERRREILESLSKADIFDATAANKKFIDNLTKEGKKVDETISALEHAKKAIEDRAASEEETIRANAEYRRAEEQFSRSLRLDEELQANHDLLVKEEQFRENQNRLAEYSRQRSMMQLSFDTEQSLAQIRLGMWNKSTAAEWFSRAAGFRNTITNLMNQASSSEDANEVEIIHRDISDMRQRMFSALAIANALKDPGMRPERVDLQGLTSLAGRGGWMGEQYRQPEYMSTLDKMYDTLKSIDDNTRAAEKSVWQ